MRKQLLFFILVLLIIAGLYLYKYKKNLPLPIKTSSQNQTPTATHPLEEKKEEPTIVEETVRELTLEIYEPKDRSVVNHPNLTLKGKTAAMADVFVNEKELKADSQGNFSAPLNLDEGENIITIVASDNEGNYAEKELMVTLESVE